MKRLNWKITLSNLAEAREQIEQIEERAKNGKKPSEIEFQIMLEHVYHHLNFAWNIRHTATTVYANLSDEEFNKWSRYPQEIIESKIEQTTR